MKIGRNDICFCGSGKKYKNCCGKKDDKTIDFLEAQGEKEKNSIPNLLMQFIEDEYYNEFILYLKKAKAEFPKLISEIIEDAENILFLESFIIHNKLEDGSTLLEKFIKKNKRDFREITVNWLQDLRTIEFSLYEITDINLEDKEIRLKDLLRDGIWYLKHTDKHIGFKQGQAMWCQLIADGQYNQPFLSSYYLDAKKKDVFLKRILKLQKDSNLNLNDFLREYSFILLKTLITETNESIEVPEAPETIEITETANTSTIAVRDDVSDIKEHPGGRKKKLHTSKDLSWPKGPYGEVANLLESELKSRQTPLQISNAIKLWYDFLQKNEPRIVKPLVWVAVIEYAINIIENDTSLTQRELAETYKIAPSTISNNYVKLVDLLELELLDSRYSSSAN